MVEYCERGHVPWRLSDGQYPYSTRIRLAQPLDYKGVVYRFIWYTSMEDVNPAYQDKVEIPIRAGDWLGAMGSGNGVPHLHFGVLTDRSQRMTMPWRDIATLIWGLPSGVITVPGRAFPSPSPQDAS